MVRSIPWNMMAAATLLLFLFLALLSWQSLPVDSTNTDMSVKSPTVSLTKRNILTPVSVMRSEVKFVLPKKVASVNGTWQVVKENWVNKEIFLFSAYLDERDSIEHRNVRVMGIIDKEPKDLHCLLWAEDASKQPTLVKAVRNKAGPWYSRHNKRFQGEVFSCGVGYGSAAPTLVSILSDPKVQPTTLMKVKVPEKIEVPLFMGVCINTPVGEQVQAVQMTEWMEMLKTFGVSEVTLYNHTDIKHLENVTAEYIAGQEMVIHSVPQVMEDEGDETLQLMEAVIINDCLYRNLYRYRAVITMDFNDLIIPKTAYDYVELLEQMQRKHPSKHPATAYLFRNAYFFLSLPSPETPDFLRTLRYKYRSAPDEFGVSGRGITSPLACVVLAKQTCSKIVPKYDTPGWLVDVSIDLGMNHRYEECMLDEQHSLPGLCENRTSVLYRDDAITNFQQSLVTSVTTLYLRLGMENIIFGQDFESELEDPLVLLNATGQGQGEMDPDAILKALQRNTGKLVKVFGATESKLEETAQEEKPQNMETENVHNTEPKRKYHVKEIRLPGQSI